MRFAFYAGSSVALAASVVFRALHERTNFYSVCVYLAQSNACIMILTNLVLLVLGSFLLGLQKLLYGPLRPIEVEQLYEKAWFAITETCLAMTVFRQEVGAFFIVMFVSLLVGKVWGWIGEGRVEILEQQPPANPRLFHARLSTSLALSFLFDAYLLNYAITTVANQAEPNMMVMFAFEFAVLTVTSLSTCARYGLSLREAAVIHKQTAQRLSERRRLLLQERKVAADQAQENGEEPPEFPPVEEEIDELDIDVPGWEEKGRWAFYLDLTTDFLKLILYLTFFCVLCIFHGMPIHIIRDVALTVRSFYSRVTDFIKYRHATRDMNERYPDATAEEIQREDTCIICREPMQPWQPPETIQGDGPAPMEERLRPKKLPCGHILHFACLRSWLERQQKCPTCRQDVVVTPQQPGTQNQQGGGHAPNRHHQNGAPRGGGNRENAQPPQNRIRFFNLGPVRLGFGAGNDPQLLREQLLNQRGQRQQRPQHRAQDDASARAIPNSTASRSDPASNDIPSQMQRLERQLMQQVQTLQLQSEQLRLLHGMQREFARLSTRQQAIQLGELDHGSGPIPPPGGIQGYGPVPEQQPLNHDHPDLPPGLSIPEGWHITPLTQIPPPAAPQNFIPPLRPFPIHGASLGGDANEPPHASSSGPQPNFPADAARNVTSTSTHRDSDTHASDMNSTSTTPNAARLGPSSSEASAPPLNAARSQTGGSPESTAGTNVVSAGLPNWGSQPHPAEPLVSADPSEVGSGINGDKTTASESASSSKGKERAATLEDASEEETTQ